MLLSQISNPVVMSVFSHGSGGNSDDPASDPLRSCPFWYAPVPAFAGAKLDVCRNLQRRDVPERRFLQRKASRSLDAVPHRDLLCPFLHSRDVIAPTCLGRRQEVVGVRIRAAHQAIETAGGRSSGIERDLRQNVLMKSHNTERRHDGRGVPPGSPEVPQRLVASLRTADADLRAGRAMSLETFLRRNPIQKPISGEPRVRARPTRGG